MHTLYLSLGTNLGDKELNIRHAITQINKLIGTVKRQSAFYVTDPWGFSSSHLFVNAAVCVETSLTPQQVLESTQDIEQQMGRKQKSVQGVYHDRIIDIDLLLYDDIKLCSKQLTLPHPLMLERDFVMKPLSEILDSKGKGIIKQLQENK